MKPIRRPAVNLLVALVVMFVSAPFVEDFPHGDWIESILLTVVMLLAVVAGRGGHRVLVIALFLLGSALAARWLNQVYPHLLHPALFLTASTAYFSFVIGRLLVHIVQAPRVDANVLCAGVSGFLLLGLVWSPPYLTLGRLTPAAFTSPVLDSFTANYFSYITLCTVGYGDIAPLSKTARMLAAMESITGLFYMAILISRLVSMYSPVKSAAVANDPK